MSSDATVRGRILLVNDLASGGGAEEIYQLSAQTLRDYGFEVSTLDCSDIPDTSITNNKVWNIAACRVLSQRIQTWQPDSIWIHNFHNFFSLAMFRVLRRQKKVRAFRTFMTLHDYQLMGLNPTLLTYDCEAQARPLPESAVGTWRALCFRATPKGLTVDFLRKVYWSAGKRLARADQAIDVFLCPSPFMKSMAERVGLGQTRYLPQPCFVPPVEPKATINDQRKLRLVFLGRLGPEKGLSEFVDLLARIKFERVESLTVIGDGPDLSRVKRTARAAGVSERIRFVGRILRDEAFEIVAAHDAMVVPSIAYENAPMVVVEAANLGLPVLTLDHGSLASFAASTGNKFFYEPTLSGLATALDRISVHLAHTHRRYELGEFTLENYAQNLVLLFDSSRACEPTAAGRNSSAATQPRD